MSDLAIAQRSTMKPIKEIASKINVPESELEFYGKYKAKLPLSLIDEKKASESNLILVSAINPTPAGEGKTTVAIGLAEALALQGKKTIAVLREPSLGPVFGVKGGATGGGYSQVLPMEDINLHFTGDFSAIEKANNLLAAMIDNSIQNKKNNIGIDGRTVRWKRVMDMNDRALRNIIIGLGGTANGIPRESGFHITAASEVMAILCMASDFADLKHRLGNIFVGFTFDKKPVFARDLKAEGAMAVLLKDAIKPNLVQTIGGLPTIIHGGPFANIAQGTNTIIATKMGLSLGDYVVTEAGFGCDLGGEKFLNIKCSQAKLSPKCVVIVATIRALKYHGGIGKEDLAKENVDAVKRGLENLKGHVENVKKFMLPPVVALNRFSSDTDAEMKAVKEECEKLGVRVILTEVWAKGGKGAEELAKVVSELTASNKNAFKPTYDRNATVEEKIERIAKNIYGAEAVQYGPKALADLKIIKTLGFEQFPVCMAKTQYSFSDNPKLLGRPSSFTLLIREIEIAAGAGFLVPSCGDIVRLPGLPEHPASERIDIDEDGNISGLF